MASFLDRLPPLAEMHQWSGVRFMTGHLSSDQAEHAEAIGLPSVAELAAMSQAPDLSADDMLRLHILLSVATPIMLARARQNDPGFDRKIVRSRAMLVARPDVHRTLLVDALHSNYYALRYAARDNPVTIFCIASHDKDVIHGVAMGVRDECRSWLHDQDHRSSFPGLMARLKAYEKSAADDLDRQISAFFRGTLTNRKANRPQASWPIINSHLWVGSALSDLLSSKLLRGTAGFRELNLPEAAAYTRFALMVCQVWSGLDKTAPPFHPTPTTFPFAALLLGEELV